MYMESNQKSIFGSYFEVTAATVVAHKRKVFNYNNASKKVLFENLRVF